MDSLIEATSHFLGAIGKWRTRPLPAPNETTGKLHADYAVPGNTAHEDELAAIATEAQANLAALEAVIASSSRDVQTFGTALTHNTQSLGSLDAVDPAIASLIQLTKAMIVKTHAAEDELRTRGVAMASLQASLAEARVKADTDALTGLFNRRAFDRLLGSAGARAQGSGQPCSLAICDIDHFKRVNDSHGHGAGDRVLQFVSNVLKDHAMPRGTVARIGGEEFVIIFEETTIDEAYEIIERARRDLTSRNIINKGTRQPIGAISFSAGIGALGPSYDVGAMLRSADHALYRAKAEGRNCVLMQPGG